MRQVMRLTCEVAPTKNVMEWYGRTTRGRRAPSSMARATSTHLLREPPKPASKPHNKKASGNTRDLSSLVVIKLVVIKLAVIKPPTLFQLERSGVKLVVHAAFGNELVVAAAFNNATVVKNDNGVGVANR